MTTALRSLVCRWRHKAHCDVLWGDNCIGIRQNVYWNLPVFNRTKCQVHGSIINNSYSKNIFILSNIQYNKHIFICNCHVFEMECEMSRLAELCHFCVLYGAIYRREIVSSGSIKKIRKYNFSLVIKNLTLDKLLFSTHKQTYSPCLSVVNIFTGKSDKDGDKMLLKCFIYQWRCIQHIRSTHLQMKSPFDCLLNLFTESTHQ